MNINKKLEKIRQQPEHVRMRYVWSFVAISMFFIIIIWIFSLEESFKKNQLSNEQKIPDLKQNMEEFKAIKEATPSIEELFEGVRDTAEEELKNELESSPKNIDEESLYKSPEATPTETKETEKQLLPIE